jgi:FixJ family two-component response regulator
MTLDGGLLDVRIPGLTGLDLQAALARAKRELSIVSSPSHVDVPGSVRAMKQGAVDLLTKPVDANDLLAAVQRALTKDLQTRVTEARLASIQERVQTLTPRETQVFALVVTGMLNKQIAAEPGIAQQTVKVHRARVMEKIRAGSLAELVRLADHAGMVVPQV